jgi:hypothetical protein
MNGFARYRSHSNQLEYIRTRVTSTDVIDITCTKLYIEFIQLESLRLTMILLMNTCCMKSLLWLLNVALQLSMNDNGMLKLNSTRIKVRLYLLIYSKVLTNIAISIFLLFSWSSFLVEVKIGTHADSYMCQSSNVQYIILLNKNHIERLLITSLDIEHVEDSIR